MVANLIGGSSRSQGCAAGRPTILVRPNQLAEHRSAIETRSRRTLQHIGNGCWRAAPLLVGLVARRAGGEMAAAAVTTEADGARGQRLAELILERSRRTGLGAGARLPTERQLSVDLGVTRSSVRHALAILEAG